MASVIRDARIEPERMLLMVGSRSSQAIRKPVSMANPAGNPGAARAAESTAMPVAAETIAEPVVPRVDVQRSAEGHAAYGIKPVVDHAAEQASLRERLELERIDVLEKAEADGFAAGLARGAQRYEEQIDALRKVIASARNALESGIAGTEDVMVEIAFEAICKMLGDAMLRPEGVVAVVREVLSTLHERERLLVRVSPADYEVLEQQRAQLLQGEDGKAIDLVADERVLLGGCLVETTGGILDGRLETQLQRLIDILTSERRMQGEGA